MKNALSLACALLFVSAVGFAQMPSQPPLSAETLAAILSLPSRTGSCDSQSSGVLFAAKAPRNGLLKALCTATATCESGTISCQSNVSSSSCTAVDRNCDIGQRGYVTCDGVTTYCPTECPCEDTAICCQCYATNDCFACCRCSGGTIRQCSLECG